MTPRAPLFAAPTLLPLLAAVGLLLSSPARAQSIGEGLPKVAFFPPGVPVFGAPVQDRLAPRNPGTGLSARFPAPDGLGDLVNEWFYPPLGTWLLAEKGGRRLQSRLDAYRAQRFALLTALQDQLTLLQDAEPAARERALRAFAETQAAGLAALEQEAEALREDLASGGLFDNASWNAHRQWKLGEAQFRTDALEKEAEFQVVRAAAFYEPGLLPQQRGLLRELALDLQLIARAARLASQPNEDAAAMFFSPETSRFVLPRNLAPELIGKIGRYNGEKAALKNELRELVRKHDASSPARRARAFSDLKDRQAPRFAQLEEMAEEIRQQLAKLPQRPPPPAPPTIPAGLLKEINSFNDDRAALYRERDNVAREAANNVPPPTGYFSPDERAQRHREYIAAGLQAQREAAEQFNRDHLERFSSLYQRYQTIRTLLAGVAAGQNDPVTGKPLDPDSLLKLYVSSLQAFDALGREEVIYKHYRVAMLQPGLSPAQRRLLFGAALVGLAQPLPAGEMMPSATMRRPLPQS